MDIIIFAAIAGFVLYRLYKVLGTDIGFKPGENVEAQEATPVSRRAASDHKASDQLSGKIQDVQKVDPQFQPREFLEGASHAFEMILSAFNQGDSKSLKNLLAGKLYTIFEKAISTREKKKETWDNTLIRIQSSEISDVKIERKTHIFVTVKFVSDQILVTKNVRGVVIDGDPDQIEVLTDIWTFTRDATSADPNWLLVKTANAE
jgi:predicted lipid-binding transport protein (Tim44 family)